MGNPISEKIYKDTCKRIEQMSDVISFLFIKLSIPGIIFPSCLITANNYFVKDLKEESFFLPSPVVYVCRSQSINLYKW